ncbi:MAG: hypothetical protein EXS15_08380 [Phycisphaerales bacterium]|nr:hypothetical protein [Phycisphaerales bacterium]
MALVRHDELNGAVHFDWFLAGESTARTFRCAGRLDQLSGDSESQLVEINDHRLFYVHLAERFELSDGRGSVTPVARGWWRPSGASCDSRDELIELRWAPSPSARTYRLTRESRLVPLACDADS